MLAVLAALAVRNLDILAHISHMAKKSQSNS